MSYILALKIATTENSSEENFYHGYYVFRTYKLKVQK